MSYAIGWKEVGLFGEPLDVTVIDRIGPVDRDRVLSQVPRRHLPCCQRYGAATALGDLAHRPRHVARPVHPLIIDDEMPWLGDVLDDWSWRVPGARPNDELRPIYRASVGSDATRSLRSFVRPISRVTVECDGNRLWLILRDGRARTAVSILDQNVSVVCSTAQVRPNKEILVNCHAVGVTCGALIQPISVGGRTGSGYGIEHVGWVTPEQSDGAIRNTGVAVVRGDLYYIATAATIGIPGRRKLRTVRFQLVNVGAFAKVQVPNRENDVQGPIGAIVGNRLDGTCRNACLVYATDELRAGASEVHVIVIGQRDTRRSTL